MKSPPMEHVLMIVQQSREVFVLQKEGENKKTLHEDIQQSKVMKTARHKFVVGNV